MAMKEVVDAAEKRLVERWSSPEAVAARIAAGLPECPVVGINLQGNVPDDGSEFVEAQYPVAVNRQMDLAGTRYREEGTIRFIVHGQRGDGAAKALTLAAMLATLFRGKKFDGVQTFAPSSPAIDDRNDDGLYFSVSVSVPYQFDFTDDAGFYA